MIVSVFGMENDYRENFKKPKVLFVGQPLDRIAVDRLIDAIPVDFTFYSTAMGELQLHHLTDKPLEEKKEVCLEVQNRNKKYLGKLISDLKNFDVLILSVRPEKFDIDLQKKIVSWIKSGGKIIYLTPSWEIVFKKEQPLTEVMPVKSGVYKYKAWNTGQDGATDNPLVRGLPLEVLGNQFYGPIYEPANYSCERLTIQRKGKIPAYKKLAGFFYKKIGSKGGEVIFIPSRIFAQKSIWKRGSYASYEPERPDDVKVWTDLMERMIYSLTYGKKAYPVLLNIVVENMLPISNGQPLKFKIEADKFIKTDSNNYDLTVRIFNRRLGSIKQIDQKIELKANEKKSLDFDIKLPNFPVDKILLEAYIKNKNGKNISKAYTWLPLKPLLDIEIKTGKSGYLSGEKIPVSVVFKDLNDKAGMQAEALLVDYKGKAFQKKITELSSLADSNKWDFTFNMPEDKSGKQYSWWITVLIKNKAQTLAIKRLQFYNDELWDMRKQLQFSVWSFGKSNAVMELYRDAGFNSLGYQGTPYLAELYGWRRYDEGTGIDTFSVTVDYDNWSDTKNFMKKRIDKLNNNTLSSRSLALVSLGEESGFKGGWGTRYYWKEDKAPAIPQKVFDNYLSELYKGDIKRLNVEWGTEFKSFAEIPLEKTYSKGPKIVAISGENYAKDSKEKKWDLEVDVKHIDPNKKYIAKTSRYLQTYNFYDWYYQKYCDMATDVFRKNRNPVSRTIMSAPGGFYPKVDVYNFNGIGPFHAKERSLAENELARKDYGDVPGFSGAIWAYFDLYRLWNSELFSYLAAGDTHIDYWVDFPLTFNYDMSHTRSSFWTKRLRHKIKNLEPLLLHKRVYYTSGLGIFTGKQPIPKGVLGRFFSATVSPNAAIYSAFEKSGCFPKFVNSNDLNKMNVVVASYAEVVTPEEGKELKTFVENGGLLIATPWLASCSEFGNLLSVYPSEESGLGELLGFRLLNTSQEMKKEQVIIDSSESIPIKASVETLTVDIRTLSSGRDKIIDLKKDVKILAKYADGAPAILEHNYGNGKVLYFNFIFCWQGWWKTFFRPERKAFRALIEKIIEKDGKLKKSHFISYESHDPEPQKGWWGTSGLKDLEGKWLPGDSVPYWGTTAYTDPAGGNKYFFIFSDHRAPSISAKIDFTDKTSEVYDIYNGKKLTRDADGKIKLSLKAGDGTILALVKTSPKELLVDVPEKIIPGELLTVKVKCSGASQEADYGIMLETVGPDGKPEELFSSSNWTVDKGVGSLNFQVPLNQPAGTYRIKATEVVTGLTAEKSFEILPSETGASQELLQPFPSDMNNNILTMSQNDFIDNLKKLREIYFTESSGLDAKYLLSYFLYVPFIAESRHHIMHRLAKQDWSKYVSAVAENMKAGEYFYLTGEDLGVDTESGLRIDNRYPDRSDFLELLAKVPGAERETIVMDGRELTVIKISDGKLIYDPISLTQFYLSEDFVAWHKGWLKNLKNNKLIKEDKK
jgi:hypothetical protein